MDSHKTQSQLTHSTELQLLQLPTELIDMIIDFALTGTGLSIITTYRSFCELGGCFKQLASRYYTSRMPLVSYNNCNTRRHGYYSMRKLCKDFGPYSGLVLALKRDNSQSKMDQCVDRTFVWRYVWKLDVRNRCTVE